MIGTVVSIGSKIQIFYLQTLFEAMIFDRKKHENHRSDDRKDERIGKVSIERQFDRVPAKSHKEIKTVSRAESTVKRNVPSKS